MTPEMAEYQMLADAHEWDYLGPSVTAVVMNGIQKQEAEQKSVKKPGKSAPTTPRANGAKKAANPLNKQAQQAGTEFGSKISTPTRTK